MHKLSKILFLPTVLLSSCSLLPKINRPTVSNVSSVSSKNDSSDSSDSSNYVTPSTDLTLDFENETATYGFYPQKYVGDKNLIRDLESLAKSETLSNGWVKFNGSYYVKKTAKPFDYSTLQGQTTRVSCFEDGTEISKDIDYWFECSPIEWQILCVTGDNCLLVSKDCLDVGPFNSNETVPSGFYPNSWEVSYLREFLNGEFYNNAFIDKSYLVKTEVDNSAATVEQSSQYAIDVKSEDYVFALSYRECAKYFDDKGKSKLAFTTDYNRAMGAWYMYPGAGSYEFAADYHLRSPSSSSPTFSYRVNENGRFWTYDVKDEFGSIRPAITVSTKKIIRVPV